MPGLSMERATFRQVAYEVLGHFAVYHILVIKQVTVSTSFE